MFCKQTQQIIDNLLRFKIEDSNNNDSVNNVNNVKGRSDCKYYRRNDSER